jgi:hypothetical protein
MKNLNLKSLILDAFKVGLFFNISTIVLAVIYIWVIENYFKPFDFRPDSVPVELGTILTGSNTFDFKNPKNLKTIPRFKAIQNYFDFFVPDTAFRDDDRAIKSPRIERWCKANPCWVHRINYNDPRKRDYRTFTIDDWFFKNKSFLNTSFENAKVFPLDVFLRTLPPGSVVVLNEPLTLFQQHKLNFKLFTDWVLVLRRKHPHLHFKLGLQLHFQWLDTQWFRLQSGLLFSQFSKFSIDYNIPWGVSEFSIYERIWRRRLVATYDRSGRRTDSITSLIESAVPDRLRRAIVLHQAYLIHRAVVKAGASYIVEWGNFPTIWFSGEIDADYRSTFALFDWQGRPLPMYWAVIRGLHIKN